MNPPIDSGNRRSRQTPRFGPACLFALTLTVLPLSASGPRSQQAIAPADPLQPIAFLLGQWEGTSEGQPGAAKVQREYTRVLGRYIRVQNRSVYAYVVLGVDQFEERFEIAEPGKDFDLYSHARLTRVK